MEPQASGVLVGHGLRHKAHQLVQYQPDRGEAATTGLSQRSAYSPFVDRRHSSRAPPFRPPAHHRV